MEEDWSFARDNFISDAVKWMKSIRSSQWLGGSQMHAVPKVDATFAGTQHQHQTI